MAKYQTADEWLKTQKGVSGGSGGQYQTAEEWLSKNARSINETHFAVKREANRLREEWASRKNVTNQGRQPQANAGNDMVSPSEYLLKGSGGANGGANGFERYVSEKTRQKRLSAAKGRIFRMDDADYNEMKDQIMNLGETAVSNPVPPDFEEKPATSKQYKQSAHSGQSGKFGGAETPFRGAGGGGALPVPEPGSFDDFVNHDLNDRAETGWQQYLDDREAGREDREAAEEWLNGFHLGVDPMTAAVMRMSIDDSYKIPSDQWTQEERDVYGLLYQTNPEKAEQFAIETNNSYNARQQEKQEEAVRQFADDHPVIATVAGDTAQALGVGMADFLTAGIEKFARGTITQKDFVSPHQASEALTGEVAENLNDAFGTVSENVPIFGGRGFGDAYQLFNSVIVSAATANATGPLGTDVVFFGNAAASALDDAKRRGATDEQALLMALIAGSAEAAGEHFSATHLLEMTDSKTIKAFFGSLFGQAVQEGEEESFTSLVNKIADNYIMRDKSQFYYYLAAYKEKNPEVTDEEAKKAAWKQMWSDTAFDTIGGIASGGIHTVTQIGGMKVLNAYSDHQVKSKFGQFQSEILQNAETAAPGSDAVKAAKEAMNSGKDLSGAQLRALLTLTEGAEDEKSGEVLGKTKQSTQQDKQNRTNGIAVIRNQAGEDLIQEAKANGVNEKLIQLAEEKVQKDIAEMNRRERKAAELAMGQLHQATIQAQTEQAEAAERETFQQAAQNRITELMAGQEQTEGNGTQEASEAAAPEEKSRADAGKAAEALTKAAYGEELSAEEKKTVAELGGEEMIQEIANSRGFQQALEEKYTAISRAMEDTAAMTKDLTSQRETVERFAAENGMDANVMKSAINRGQNAMAFNQAWQSAYDMGAGGIALRYAQKARVNSYLTAQQIETAYNEGRKAAESYEAEKGYTAVPDGGQWNDRAYSGGQVRTVEGWTAEQGGEGGAGGTAAAAAEKVTSIQLGLTEGTENRNLRRVAEAAYNEDTKVAARVARDNGLEFVAVGGGAIETMVNVNGEMRVVKSRGCVVDGKMFVRVDDSTFTAEQIARHEAAHEQIRKGEIDVEQTRQKLLEQYSDGEIEAIIELYASAYGDSGLTAEEVLEEIICDAEAQMNAFATAQTERIAGEVGVFLRSVGRSANTQKVGAKKNTTGDGGVKRSIQMNANGGQYDYSKPFSQQLEDYKNGIIPTGDTLIVGPTPDVLRGIGLSALPITINTTHVDYALNGTKDLDHHLGKFLLKQLPNALSNPVAIMTSGTKAGSSLVVMLEVQHNGKQIVVPIVVDGFGYQNGIRIDSNAITSVYGKNNAVSKVLHDAIVQERNGAFRLYYLDKKKATALLQGAKVPMPKMPATHNGGYVHSLTDAGSPVKMKYGSITQTQQFKRWFGDWQKHPDKASKVVNADGTPKVVYHGTNKDFTVFQSASGMYWFSESKDYAEEMAHERRGKNVIGAYLNIKNPYVAKLPANQFSNPNYEAGIIRKARAGKHDGIILMNDTDNDLVAETFYVVFDNKQIKSATDNIGTFDGSNPDIRYSREMDTVKALERQNEILKERVEYWKDQTRRTKAPTADKASVRRLGREILSSYSSDTKVDEILPELQWLANDALGKKGASYEELVSAAENVARKVLEGSGVDVNGELAETRQALKKYLRSTPINVTESIKAGIPDFADYKKQNRALLFREDGSGTDVDRMWLELQDRFGKGMFPEDVMNPEDQVRYIADKLAAMAEDIQNPYQKDMEFAVQQLTYDILFQTTMVEQKKPTRADQAAEKTDKAVEKATEEMRKLLEKGRQRENDRIVRAQQAELRQRIKTISDQFQRMATRPGKGISQHAPEKLRRAVIDFCGIFTESELRRMDRWEKSLEYRADKLTQKMGEKVTKSAMDEYNTIENQQARRDRMTARLTALQNAYAAMEKDGEYQTTYDQDVADMIQKLSGVLEGKDMYQLNNKELRQVQKTMTAIYYTITNANKAFAMGKDKTITGMATKMAGEIRQVNPSQAGMAVALKRFMQWQMSPDTFFNYICGYVKNNEGKVIQKGFQRGAERMLATQREFYQMFREFTESDDGAVTKELNNLMNYSQKRMVNWGLKDLEGNEVKTTRGMMLQAYMLLNQQDSFESLQYGGFSLPNADRYYKGDVSGSYGDALETQMMSEPMAAGYTEMVQRNKSLDSRIEELQQKLELADSETYKQRYQGEIQALEKQVRENQQKMETIANQAAQRLSSIRDAIEQQLTPLERKLIDRAHEWYAHSGKLMQDVFQQMYGFRANLEENYVPIHRDPSTIKTDIRDMAGAEKAFNLENSGFTIERVKNYQPILLTDFFEEITRQRDKMARYVGFAQVQKDFGKIWKTRINGNGMTVNTLVRARFGAGKTKLGVSGEEYVNHYIADVAGGHSSDDILSKFYGNYAAATLRLNLRVAASQAASIPTAASVVGWKHMTVGFAKGLPKAMSTKYRNELAGKNVWFYKRYQGEGGSTELADIRKKGGMIERIANSKTGKKLFNWCQAVDVFSTGSIMWCAAESYVQEQGIQKGTAEYDAAVNEVYTDIIRKSQPNYTTTERSDLLRDQRAHMKLLTMFKTQSNQNFNLLLEANGEFIRMKQDMKNGRNGVTEADVKAAGKKLVNASAGVLLGGTVSFVAIRTILNFILGAVNPYRDDETGEVTLEATLKGIGEEILSSLAGTVALGGQVYDILMPIMTGDKYYGLSDSAVSSLSSMLENTITVLQKGTDASEKQLWKMVNSWCVAMGIPSGNAKKIKDMFDMYIRDIQNGTFGQYTSPNTTDKQYRDRIMKHYLAGEMDKADDALGMLFTRSSEDNDEDARKKIAEGMRDYLKDRYIEAEVTDTEAEKIMAYTGTDEPEKYTARWDFQLAHPEMDSNKVSDALVKAYGQKGSISEQVFLDAWEFAKNAKADKDKDGKTINGSKKQKIVDYVQAIPGLSKDQRRKLFELLNAGEVKGTPFA